MLRLPILVLSSLLVLFAPSRGIAEDRMRAIELPDTRQIVLREGNTRILQYNYRTVEPGELLNKVAEGNRIYARARSDYIHPLYGPQGEELTRDWPIDHPHHRGIYWAWPEVDWQGQRGDLHALQQVFARPTGKVRIEQGSGYVQFEAENEWRWEDRTPIVRELVIIRAHRLSSAGRAIDLHFQFRALGTDVQVARRGQTQYGGLNVRLSPAQNQEILTFTDPPGTPQRRAWAHRSGIPRGGQSIVGLTILQSSSNPDYPCDWVQFPNLFWVQPTFPAAGTRYTITKDRPLDLRYRLWISDGKQEPSALGGLCTAYNSSPVEK